MTEQLGRYPFVQPGDIFFTRGTGYLARAIRWAQRMQGEPETWANHVGGVTSPGYLVPPRDKVGPRAKVSEALWRTMHHHWWDAHKDEQGYAVAAYRPRHFTGNEGVNRVVENWVSRTDDRYGWWRLFTYLIEKISAGKIPATKLHFKKDRMVCSNHIAIGLVKDGIHINDHDPQELDPDEMQDYCATHPEEFKFIGQATVPARRVA